MTRLKGLALVSMAAVSAAAVSWAGIIPAEVQDHRPLILMYHDIVPHFKNDDATSDMTGAAFDEQMSFLAAQGFKTLSLDELYAYYKTGKPIPVQSVVLTFDDGYSGDYNLALPVLKRLGMKASFFVHTHYVGTTTTKEHMTWEQLIEIDANPLFKVYSHTLTHPKLPTLDDKQLEAELKESQIEMIAHLHGARPYVAYPWGLHDERVVNMAKKYYTMGFAVYDSEKVWDRLYQIPRFPITRDLVTLDAFKEKIGVWLK